MKIIKRNGSEAVFDITKIISAISKANKVVPEAQRLTKQQIIEISKHKPMNTFTQAEEIARNRAPDEKFFVKGRQKNFRTFFTEGLTSPR